MIKIRFVSCLLVLLSAISGCSIQVSQDTISSLPLQATSADPSLPTFKIPVTWAHLNLTGKLIYISAGQSGNSAYMRIQSLDLLTGQGATIYQAPENGF